MPTEFGVDSSSRFPFRARTRNRQTHTVANATDHLTQNSTTTGVGNELGSENAKHVVGKIVIKYTAEYSVHSVNYFAQPYTRGH